MLTLVKGLIQLVSAIVVVVSIKVEISFWLALSLGVLVLAIGAYSAIQKKLRAIIEIGAGTFLLIPLLKVAVPVFLSLPFGILLFIESIAILVPLILE